MLFKLQQLQGIRDGRITMAFRNWDKPAVRRGSQIKTAIGVVVVDEIVIVQWHDVTQEEAQRAGYETLSLLHKELARFPGDNLYKLQLRYLMEDPRLKLREEDELDVDALATLKEKVDRLDRFSKTGIWTAEVLRAIETNPYCRAADLASLLGREKEWLKLHIRKLKNLGLTISHETGYTLSPRGKVYLRRCVE